MHDIFAYYITFKEKFFVFVDIECNKVNLFMRFQANIFFYTETIPSSIQALLILPTPR